MLLETISRKTRVPVETLEKIAASASRRYKVYEIPKKTGGTREISHPSRTLKALQRWITRNILSKAPIHHAATAYKKGASIKENALIHAGTAYTLRMDFSDFFPSFDHASVGSFLRELSDANEMQLDDHDVVFMIKILCRNGKLTIGSPSSPALTNAMMFNIDKQISEFSAAQELIYTRYADDIFLSSHRPDILGKAEEELKRIVSNSSRPILKFNEKKTLHLSMARHRNVTGLILKTDGGISIGREHKRKLRTMVYLAKNGKLKASDKGYLAGMIAFVNDVEPEFLVSLSRKFDIDTLEWAKSL